MGAPGPSLHQRPWGRQLHQAEVEITSVTTGQGLIDAVVAGAKHIRIEEHLDLTLASLDRPKYPVSPSDSMFGGNYYLYAGYVDAARTDTIMVSPQFAMTCHRLQPPPYRTQI